MYLIVGAGPAGLQMGFFLKEAQANYLIVEKEVDAGSFFARLPIHRRLISINKKHNFFEEEEFNLRHDWNSLLSNGAGPKFTDYSDELFPHSDTLHRYLNDFAEDHGLNIRYGLEVSFIKKNSQGLFEVAFKNGVVIECKVLLMATGVRSQNIPQDIEGIEHTLPYKNVPIDSDLFINKRVAILGGGNSAFETANEITGKAAFVHLFLRSPLKFAYDSHFVGNLRAKYTNILDMFHLKSLHGLLNPRIRSITKLSNGSLQTQHEYDFPDSPVPGTLKLTREYDFIINCTGFRYTCDQLFDESARPETIMNGKFYDLNEVWQSANVENLHFIGTCMQAIDRKASSGFIHGFRYNIRTLAHLLQQLHGEIPYPTSEIMLEPFNTFLAALYKRFSIGDSVYQLYGFLGDLLEFDRDTGKFSWSRDLPVNYIRKNLQPSVPSMMLTLEFGFHHYPDRSSLEFMGPSDPHDTSKAAFLHPVIRYFYNGREEEFHFGDSLLGRWDMPHSEGGAIGSYHTEFYNWMAGIFGLELIDANSLGEDPVFDKW